MNGAEHAGSTEQFAVDFYVLTHNKRAPGPGERQQSLTRLYTGIISKGLKVLTPGTSFPNA